MTDRTPRDRASSRPTPDSGDHAAARSIVFRSPEEHEEQMRWMGFDQKIRQLASGSYQTTMTLRSEGRATLHSYQCDSAFLSQVTQPPGTMSMMFFWNTSGAAVVSGERGTATSVVLLPEGAVMDASIPSLTRIEIINLPKARLVETANTLRLDKPCAIERVTALHGNTPYLHALRTRVRDLVMQDSGPNHGLVSDVIARVVAWMDDSLNHQRPQGHGLNWRTKRIAKQAQAFVEAHYQSVVRIEDICREVGVGVRRLQEAFREYFSVTITEYLQTLRLDFVRRELAAAHPAPGAVTKAAVRHGFTHLGRFSAVYRKRFGESPRQTLYRPP